MPHGGEDGRVQVARAHNVRVEVFDHFGEHIMDNTPATVSSLLARKSLSTPERHRTEEQQSVRAKHTPHFLQRIRSLFKHIAQGSTKSNDCVKLS